MFDSLGLASLLERELGRKVDIVTRMGLMEELRDKILAEVSFV